MWTTGNILAEGTVVAYTVKHFEEGSDFGIEGGRISKLSLKVNGKITANYDKGWDVRPEDKISQAAYEILLKKYN